MALPYYKHDSAFVDDPACVGTGTKIWHFSHVMAGARIGERCVLGQNVFVGSDASLGNNVHIQNGVSIYDGVILEDDVFCGPSMVFTNVLNPRSEISKKHEIQKTIVKRGATIGANATVICGNVIGRYAFVGAGAVVTEDVPDHALVLGVPGELAGWVCRCGETLAFDRTDETERARCGACSRAYLKKDQHVGPEHA